MAPEEPNKSEHPLDDEQGEDSAESSSTPGKSEDEHPHLLDEDEIDALFAGADVDGHVGANKADASTASPDPDETVGESPSDIVHGAAEDEQLSPASGEDEGGQDAVSKGDVEPPIEDNESLVSQGILDSLLEDVHMSRGEDPPAGGAGSDEPSGEIEFFDASAEEAEDESASDEPAVRSTPAYEPPPSMPGDESDPAEQSPRSPAKPSLVNRLSGWAASWLLELPRLNVGQLLKGVTTATAGVATAVMVLALLYANPVRRADPDALAEARAADVRLAMRFAENLMELGRPAEAEAELAAAIAEAPVSPLRVDARFLRLEAAMEALPARPGAQTLDALHRDIDDLLRDAGEHPRRSEAQYWKARLYEAADMEYAARAMYEEILTGTQPVEHMDAVLYRAGNVALELGHGAEAADLFRRLIQQHPESPYATRAQMGLGDAYVRAGRQQDAELLYRQTASAMPGSPMGAEATERLARMAIEDGRYEDAVEALRQRLSAATTIEGNDRLYLLLARSQRAMGAYADAEQTLRELLNFFPETEVTPMALVELARVLDAKGQRGEAVRLARRAASQYSEPASALYAAGAFLRDAGEMQDAAAAFANAAEAGAGDAVTLLAAGKAYYELGELDAALDMLNQVKANAPGTTEAYEAEIMTGRVYHAMGRVGDAVEQLEPLPQAAAEPAQRLDALSALAAVYLDLGLLRAARETYGRLTALTTDPEQLAEAAIALLEAQAWDEGLSVSNRVEPADLSDEKAYRLLSLRGEALLRADPARGVAKLEEAREAYPDRWGPGDDLKLLRAYLGTDQSAAARQLVTDLESRARRSPALAPYAQRAAVRWGDFLYERGDYRAAADAYAKAELPGYEDTNEADWARFQRANALMRTMDYAGSVELFNQIAESDSPWAAAAAVKAAYAEAERRLRGEDAAPVGG